MVDVVNNVPIFSFIDDGDRIMETSCDIQQFQMKSFDSFHGMMKVIV